MKYPKEYLEEIKTRLKVSTVVSKSVSLKNPPTNFGGGTSAGSISKHSFAETSHLSSPAFL